MQTKLYSPFEDISISAGAEPKLRDLAVIQLLSAETPDTANKYTYTPPARKLTTKKNKHSVSLEHTSLSPSSLVLVSGKQFRQMYRKQLSQALTDQSEKSVDVLLSLSATYDILRHAQTTVQLKSSRFNRRLPDIVAVLNEFFTDYAQILSSINQMVFDDTEKKAQVLEDVKPPPVVKETFAQSQDIFEH